MANLNLSEFTEKLFVADADHTFIWDTAASISKRVSRNSWLNSGTLTSDAPVTISQTWNAVAQTFTALKVNAAGTSDANSASGSLLADFQLGGVSKAWVTKQGGYRASIGQFVNGNGIGFAGGLNTGFYSVAGEQIFLAANNSVPIEFKSTSIVVNSAATFGFGQVGVGADTILLRDGAANTLALRNGAAAQTFNVYGTYTSGTSYERLTLSAPSAANAIIGTNKGSGGGTARGLEIQTDGVTRMSIQANGAYTTFNTGLFVGTTSYIGWFGNAIMYSNAAGSIWLSDTAGTNFNRLSFGGITSSFPSIKRVGSEFQVVQAGTTAAINVAAGDADLTFIEDRYRRKGSGTPEGVITAPIGAIYHNTTGGAGTSFYVKESGTGNTGWVGK